MKKDNNPPKDNSTKSENLFMIDSDLLPLINKARDGCVNSQIDLSIAFGDGEGAKKNEKLAREFEALIFNTTDNNNLKLAALWNPAIREGENGNFEAMIDQFHLAIDFMQENIPMENWDFELFAIMEKLTQERED